MRWVREVVLAPVGLYRRLVSPLLPARCKYEPSCSRYTVDAVGRFGVVRGTALSLWRLARCNPWSHGGFDPVDAQSLVQPRRPRRSGKIASR